MTQDELDVLLVEWTRRLRLQDWKIVAKVTPSNDMDNGGIEGSCSCFAPTKEAVVRVSDELGKPVGGHIRRAWPSDPEEVLVHELLHIHIDGFMPKSEDKAEYAAAEVAINMIASALVDTKRGGGQ